MIEFKTARVFVAGLFSLLLLDKAVTEVCPSKSQNQTVFF